MSSRKKILDRLYRLSVKFTTGKGYDCITALGDIISNLARLEVENHDIIQLEELLGLDNKTMHFRVIEDVFYINIAYFMYLCQFLTTPAIALRTTRLEIDDVFKTLDLLLDISGFSDAHKMVLAERFFNIAYGGESMIKIGFILGRTGIFDGLNSHVLFKHVFTKPWFDFTTNFLMIMPKTKLLLSCGVHDGSGSGSDDSGLTVFVKNIGTRYRKTQEFNWIELMPVIDMMIEG